MLPHLGLGFRCILKPYNAIAIFFTVAAVVFHFLQPTQPIDPSKQSLFLMQFLGKINCLETKKQKDQSLY